MAQVNLGHVVGPGVPTGGTAGQVLKKNGSTNFDASWATLNSGNIPISASDNTTVQQSLAAVKSDMGIVEDGNTATHTIAAGQYVIWKGALYTASAAIPSGTTLSTSNLTAVSDGGLNSLNGKFATLSTVSNLGTMSSLSAVQSALLSKAQSMNVNEQFPVKFACSFTSNGFVSNASYAGWLTVLYKTTNDLYFTVMLEGIISSSVCPIYIMYNDGSWTVDGVALKSDMLYFGPVKNEAISLNQTSGIVYVADFSDLTAPTVPGKTFIGYVGFIDTYRAAVLGFGGQRCYYIISAQTTADATVKVYPMYK